MSRNSDDPSSYRGDLVAASHQCYCDEGVRVSVFDAHLRTDRGEYSSPVE